MIAARIQVIDDAIRLINRFPEPPVGNQDDLQGLKHDLKILSAKDVMNVNLHLEDEARSRIVAQLALYSIPPRPKFLGLPDRKCPCCF